MVRKLPILILLFCSHFLAHSQDPHSFRFDTDDALPSSEVYDVVLDATGMPWFSTDRGACSYDGYTFRGYSKQDGLSDNTCLGIRMDPQGRLWFIGLDGSLSVKDAAGMRPFAWNYQISDLLGEKLIVRVLAWDAEGQLYFICNGGTGRRIVVGDVEKGGFRWTNFEELALRYPAFSVGEYRFLRIGETWISENNAAQNMLERDGAYYFASELASGMVFRGDLQSGEIEARIDLGTKIHDIYFDREEVLWVCTGDGMYAFPGGEIETPPRKYFDEVAMCRMQQDQEGNYWLSTLEKGVFLVPSFAFKEIEWGAWQQESGKVTSMTVLGNQLLLGTRTGKIFSLDTSEDLRLLQAEPRDAGRITFASARAGLATLGPYALRGEGKTLRVDSLAKIDRENIVVPLRDGKTFLAGQGAYAIAGGDSVEDYPSVLPHRLHCIWEADSVVWLGTQKGLWQVVHGDFAHPRRVFAGVEALAGRINDIKADGRGNLWVATVGNGLVGISGDAVTVIGTREGLNSEMVNRIAFEGEGSLWLATNRGMNQLVYTPTSPLALREINSITSRDGLPDNSVLDLAFWEGEVWAATNAGLVHFPSEVAERGNFPVLPIVLEAIKVNRSSIAAEPGQRFAHWQNDLSFRFRSVSMRKPIGRAFYRYRLREAEAAWEYTNDRTARYYNLAPGAYTFEAQSQNRNGVWSPVGASFSFEILPHFSQTWWFQSLGLLLLLALLGGAFYLRLRRYQIRQAQAQKLQAARLKAQEAEITVLRNQMNPHFVFNALNSIQNFIFENDVPQANYYLSRFAQLFRDALRFSRQSWIPLSEELEFLKAYLELEAMRFTDRFSYALEVDPDLDPEQAHIPPFLFQPLLENAIKHAFKDIAYPGRLTIEFQGKGTGALEVRITDNGPGFVPEAAVEPRPYHRSMGLKIVRDRIELLKLPGGRRQAHFELVNLSQQGGQGTAARFLIPIQTNESDHH